MADGQASHTCSAHGMPAALSCARCGSFVCAQCKLAEADVGVICGACARVYTVPPLWKARRQRRETFLFTALILTALTIWPFTAAFAFRALSRVTDGSTASNWGLTALVCLLIGIAVSVRYVMTRQPSWAYGFAAALFLTGLLANADQHQDPEDDTWFAGDEAALVRTALIAGWSLLLALLTAFTRTEAVTPPAGAKWRDSQLIR